MPTVGFETSSQQQCIPITVSDEACPSIGNLLGDERKQNLK